MTLGEPACHLRFGQGGNGAACQLQGFSHPEDGFTWMLGPLAELVIPVPPGEGDLLLEMSVHAFIGPGLPAQRIGVAVNAIDLAEVTARGTAVLGVRIPASCCAAKRTLRLTFHLPDATSPHALEGTDDVRQLGCQMRELLLRWQQPEPASPPRHRARLPFQPGDTPARTDELIRYTTGLAPEALLSQFESLGHNCEFGLVQRRCGAEPQGLLRFVGIELHQLWRGLRCGFTGVSDPARLTAYASDGETPEWMLIHADYNMHTHSFQAAARVALADMVAAQAQRLSLQHRRFLEVLASGEKLFTVQGMMPMATADALPILHALRSYGDNALLFVTTSATGAAGSVDMLGPHLFRGHMDAFAPVGKADQFDLPSWLSVCANAYRLWRESGHALP